ncbi:hypothetical protein ACQPYK_11045 [Streptosporangium sp. CA-135522]|uniref:hypothetical protein n=1 Tax=Streptosporangium sp. CA-135522 TaxID=3240072 RepID=UPI003D9402A8
MRARIVPACAQPSQEADTPTIGEVAEQVGVSRPAFLKKIDAAVPAGLEVCLICGDHATRMLRRCTHRSVKEPEADIRAWIDAWNAD